MPSADHDLASGLIWSSVTAALQTANGGLRDADIVRWAEAHYYIAQGTTWAPIVLEPHQRAILHLAFPVDATFPYRTFVYSAPKKSGKTELAALVTLWAGCNWQPPGLEMFCLANDFDQAAGRVYRAACKAIGHAPALAAYCQVTGREVVFPGGNTLQALANDFAGAAGAQRLALSTWDELWGYAREAGRRLWDELTPIPTVPISMRLVTTYAGFEGESELLWDLYDRVVLKGDRVPPEELDGLDLPVYRDGATLAYWDSYNTAGEACRRMPWQQGEAGAAYYAEQQRELRPLAYKRLHWNQWTTSEDAFIQPEMWEAITDEAHRPILPDAAVVLDVGVDVGVKHDQASVMAVTFEAATRKVILARHRTFQPTPEDPIDLEETVEAFIRELHQGYRVRSVWYDPYQFHRSATTLTKAGLPMVEFPQTPANLTRLGQNLYELVTYKNLTVYPDDGLRRAALQAVAHQTSRGWRITKDNAVHKIDPLVALGHAALACIEWLSDRQVEETPHYDRAKNTYTAAEPDPQDWRAGLQGPVDARKVDAWKVGIRTGEDLLHCQREEWSVLRPLLTEAVERYAQQRDIRGAIALRNLRRLEGLYGREGEP